MIETMTRYTQRAWIRFPRTPRTRCAEARYPATAYFTSLLLLDGAAGDAVSGVAAGVGLHVVRFLVNDDGGTAIGEE